MFSKHDIFLTTLHFVQVLFEKQTYVLNSRQLLWNMYSVIWSATGKMSRGNVTFRRKPKIVTSPSLQEKEGAAVRHHRQAQIGHAAVHSFRSALVSSSSQTTFIKMIVSLMTSNFVVEKFSNPFALYWNMIMKRKRWIVKC